MSNSVGHCCGHSHTAQLAYARVSLPILTWPTLRSRRNHLDKARNGNNTANQLNLFLYQTMVNAAWRNMDMPRQVKPGETGQPPLAAEPALPHHCLRTEQRRGFQPPAARPGNE